MTYSVVGFYSDTKQRSCVWIDAAPSADAAERFAVLQRPTLIVTGVFRGRLIAQESAKKVTL